LFGELARETSTLIRQEVQLAQAEMTHKAATFGKNLAFVVVAGCLAVCRVSGPGCRRHSCPGASGRSLVGSAHRGRCAGRNRGCSAHQSNRCHEE
jgi:hypothetical protein